MHLALVQIAQSPTSEKISDMFFRFYAVLIPGTIFSIYRDRTMPSVAISWVLGHTIHRPRSSASHGEATSSRDGATVARRWPGRREDDHNSTAVTAAELPKHVDYTYIYSINVEALLRKCESIVYYR